MSRNPEIPPTDRRVNLFDLPPGNLDEALRGVVSPPWRVRQVADWLYQKGVNRFEEMENLPKPLRAELAAHFRLDLPEIVERTVAAPDGSRKTLFRLDDGGLVEAVYMPMGERTTFCLSSQAGCAVGCTFCVTGFFGAGRNLTPAEMIGQFLTLQHEQAISAGKLNIVFMGMGEPLLNFDHLVTTLQILEQQIAAKRITISTAGIIPGIEALAALPRRPNLAVSINAPDRERREEIMPITKKYPLSELMETLRRFPLERGREITIEYVLLAGYNDAPRDARLLASLLRGIRCKVNAIPFNPDPTLPDWMKRPSDDQIDRFAAALVHAGATVTVRRSKGSDISAACGQLRGKTERSQRPTTKRRT